jgi:hypothetical protein
MQEVLNLVLDDPLQKESLPPFPKKIKLTKDIAKVKVDPKISFSLMALLQKVIK